jgi:hypothetical protein
MIIDYKKLIDSLRERGVLYCENPESQRDFDAADAIDTLIAERNALIQDAKDWHLRAKLVTAREALKSAEDFMVKNYKAHRSFIHRNEKSTCGNCVFINDALVDARAALAELDLIN